MMLLLYDNKYDICNTKDCHIKWNKPTDYALKVKRRFQKRSKKKKKKKDKRRRKEMKRNWMNLITTVFLPLKSNRIWILHLSIQNISF